MIATCQKAERINTQRGASLPSILAIRIDAWDIVAEITAFMWHNLTFIINKDVLFLSILLMLAHFLLLETP